MTANEKDGQLATLFHRPRRTPVKMAVMRISAHVIGSFLGFENPAGGGTEVFATMQGFMP